MTQPFKLRGESYSWAIDHLIAEGDTDLLPTLFEFEAIKFNWNNILNVLEDLDLNNYRWSPGRRFLVPKDQLSFRIATQLTPLDNLLLSAIVKEYGHLLEQHRIPVSEKRVFSYRFDPAGASRFYGDTTSWQAFWDTSFQKASTTGINHVVITDITDYYNQIYHHTLQNELDAAGVAESVWKSIIKLVGGLTEGVSRGIPVGPHSVHLLAEIALNPIDRSMLSHSLDFCRYVDDIHIFCKSEQEARIAVYDLANILDIQQRLTLNKHKTKIVTAEEFIRLATDMMNDKAQTPIEEQILSVINKYSGNDNYAQFEYRFLNPFELEKFNRENLVELFDFYIKGDGVKQGTINYTRIRWLLRRLAQVGAPAAIDYILENINFLTPALGEVARYIMRASKYYISDFPNAGGIVLKALDDPIVAHSDYLKIVLLNLFSQVPKLNHINILIDRYSNSTPSMKREIVIAAGKAGQGYWIKELKSEFGSGAGSWLRAAILSSVNTFSGDEARFWVKRVSTSMTPLEKLITKWSLKDPDMKGLGEIKFS